MLLHTAHIIYTCAAMLIFEILSSIELKISLGV